MEPRVGDGEIEIRFDSGALARFDFVWLATGGNFDMELVPVFASLQTQQQRDGLEPIPCIGGLPQLQPDCSWAQQEPYNSLYVMGAFAQLQLGADALNLAGCRSGGVVVARALLKDFNSLNDNAGLDDDAGLEAGQSKKKRDKTRLLNRKVKGSRKGRKVRGSAPVAGGSVTATGEWKDDPCDCGAKHCAI